MLARERQRRRRYLQKPKRRARGRRDIDDLEASKSTPLVNNAVDVAGYDATKSGADAASAGDERPPLKKDLSFTSGYTTFMDSTVALKYCFFSIFLYLALAVVAFSFVFEKWTIIDSLYFGVVTFTTVGYGDFSPTTTGGRIFSIFFVLFGICILGVALGIIGERLVEANEAAMENTRNQSKARVMDTFTRKDEPGSPGSPNVIRQQQEKPPAVQKSILGDILDLLYKDFPLLAGIAVVNLAMGYYQGWDVATSLYYFVITTTTVGFGDLAPTDDVMRLVSILIIPLGVAIMAQILARIANFYMERKAEETEKAFLNREFTLHDISVMDTDNDDSVCWGEFLSFMLVAMQKVHEEDIAELREVFERLDADGSGTLQKEDLLLLAKQNQDESKEEETGFV